MHFAHDAVIVWGNPNSTTWTEKELLPEVGLVGHLTVLLHRVEEHPDSGVQHLQDKRIQCCLFLVGYISKFEVKELN